MLPPDVYAVDRASPFSDSEVFALRGYGVEAFGRYYRRDRSDPTFLSGAEKAMILGFGGLLIPIMEAAGTPVDAANGSLDGAAAVDCSLAHDQDERTPIAFVPADFDWPGTYDPDGTVPAASVAALRDYVNSAVAALSGRHPFWVYGPYDLIDVALGWPAVAGAWQAYAPDWSQGRNALPHPLADIVQAHNGVPILGLSGPVDLDRVRTPARLWRARP